MNKKGFVLMETIVVIVVVSVALLTIFSSYYKILSKIKSENKYDTSEYIYMTYWVKNIIKSNETLKTNINNLSSDGFINIGAEASSFLELENAINMYNISKIYAVKFKSDGTLENDIFKNFDAYTIDYLRRVDVDNDSTLLVVEYKKNAKDVNYQDKYFYGKTDEASKLKETYIASLEW